MGSDAVWNFVLAQSPCLVGTPQGLWSYVGQTNQDLFKFFHMLNPITSPDIFRSVCEAAAKGAEPEIVYEAASLLWQSENTWVENYSEAYIWIFVISDLYLFWKLVIWKSTVSTICDTENWLFWKLEYLKIDCFEDAFSKINYLKNDDLKIDYTEKSVHQVAILLVGLSVFEFVVHIREIVIILKNPNNNIKFYN